MTVSAVNATFNGCVSSTVEPSPKSRKYVVPGEFNVQLLIVKGTFADAHKLVVEPNVPKLPAGLLWLATTYTFVLLHPFAPIAVTAKLNAPKVV